MVFSDPFSTSAPPSAVFPSNTNALVPTRDASITTLFPSGTAGPTNRWWNDWHLLGSAGTSTYNGPSSGKLNVFPLMLRPQDRGMSACRPKQLPLYTDVAIIQDMRRDVSLAVSEAVNGRTFTAADDFSCTMRLPATAGGGAYVEFPVVRGMPYLSARYQAMTPRLCTGNAVWDWPGDADNHTRQWSVAGQTTGTVSGSRIVLTTTGVPRPGYPKSDGSSHPLEPNDVQRWILYAFNTSGAPQSITLGFSTEALANGCSASVLTATAPFTGWLRLVPLTGSDTSEEQAVLDAHAACIPTGGTFDVTVSGATATETVTWATAGTGPLLMAALPHHVDQMAAGATYRGIVWPTLRGPAQAISGTTWTMTDTLTPVSRQAPRAVPSGKVSALSAQVATDANYPFPAGLSTADIYNAGKALGGISQVANVADALGLTTHRTTAVDKLRTELTPYFDGVTPRAFYDTTWRGAVFTQARSNGANSHGHGYYNDHTLQWGYLIYAAATLAAFDASWRTTHQAAVTALVRDIANTSSADTYFPRLRYYDAYEGHSMLTGLASVEDGRGTESTSEGAMAYAGVALWGQVIGNTDMQNVGRWLLAQEIRSAQRYWHMPASSSIVPDGNLKSKKTIGIVHLNKITSDTYFGAEPAFHTNIQALPYMPVQEYLLDHEWAAEAWTDRLAPVTPTGTSTIWIGYNHALRAVSDPDGAFTAIQALTGSTGTAPTQWDWEGTTKTALLYWAATRPTPGTGPSAAPRVVAVPTAMDGGVVEPDPPTYGLPGPPGSSLPGQVGRGYVRDWPELAGRVAVDDTDFTADASIHTIALTGITTARQISLPAPTRGRPLRFVDETGLLSQALPVTLVGPVGGASQLVVRTAGVVLDLYGTGTRWITIGAG